MDRNLPTGRRPQVTVIGNAETSDQVVAIAEQVGTLLARLGCTVINGGRGGVMSGVSRGVRAGGGLCVGILPGTDLREGNPWLDVVIPSGIGFARNVTNVLAGDVVVAIGGGAGTLSEIAYAWMYGRPVIALTSAGGWSERLAGAPLDDRRSDNILRADSLDDLETMLTSELALLGFDR